MSCTRPIADPLQNVCTLTCTSPRLLISYWAATARISSSSLLFEATPKWPGSSCSMKRAGQPAVASITRPWFGYCHTKVKVRNVASSTPCSKTQHLPVATRRACWSSRPEHARRSPRQPAAGASRNTEVVKKRSAWFFCFKAHFRWTHADHVPFLVRCPTRCCAGIAQSPGWDSCHNPYTSAETLKSADRAGSWIDVRFEPRSAQIVLTHRRT